MGRHVASWLGRYGDPAADIEALASELVGALMSEEADAAAYWRAFVRHAEGGLNRLAMRFEKPLGVRDRAFIGQRIALIHAQWRAWLDAADRSNSHAYYRRFGDLVVASCWYLLCYPIAYGLRGGTAAGLDRTPFHVELVLIERDDGSEMFVPQLPEGDPAAERILRREHLLAVLADSHQDRMTPAHRAEIAAMAKIPDAELTDAHLVRLEDVVDAISDAHELECTLAGRNRLGDWIRTQAVKAARKMLATGKGDSARLRTALETPDDQWTFAMANGIQHMRAHVEGPR